MTPPDRRRPRLASFRAPSYRRASLIVVAAAVFAAAATGTWFVLDPDHASARAVDVQEEQWAVLVPGHAAFTSGRSTRWP
ncbi:hypothetical protein QFZ66_000422 [Streptomyces sp. B4I13]|nr:hypothetical protein [Streptomyces sp. B4I13]